MQKLHDRYAIVDYGFKMSSQLLPGQRDSLVFPRTCLSCLHRHPTETLPSNSVSSLD